LIWIGPAGHRSADKVWPTNAATQENPLSRTSSRNAVVLVPETRRDIDAVARQCRKLATRRALISAGASVVPIPGVDIAVDIGVLLSMIEDINAAFGLTPEQIERLAPRRKVFAYKAIMSVGSALVGRVVTRELVIQVLKTVGVRLSAKQAARVVPIAGQVVAASISFTALKYLGDRHIADCVQVADTLRDLATPGAATARGA
jgi:uncharacterized protein (DUF697 family)